MLTFFSLLILTWKGSWRGYAILTFKGVTLGLMDILVIQWEARKCLRHHSPVTPYLMQKFRPLWYSNCINEKNSSHRRVVCDWMTREVARVIINGMGCIHRTASSLSCDPPSVLTVPPYNEHPSYSQKHRSLRTNAFGGQKIAFYLKIFKRNTALMFPKAEMFPALSQFLLTSQKT